MTFLKIKKEFQEIGTFSMLSDNDRFNMDEVNSLLSQIISSMSEAEREDLKKRLITKFSDVKNGKDLSSLIASIPEAPRCKLLYNLLKLYFSKEVEHSKHLELRRYPRKLFKIPIELSKHGLTFMCFTQNISHSGAFIQTDCSFHVDQKVSMTLSPPKSRKTSLSAVKLQESIQKESVWNSMDF